MTGDWGILPAGRRGAAGGGPSFTLGNRAYRLAWRLAYWTLFRWSPPGLPGARRALLVAFGARIDPSARIASSARIWSPRNLAVGADATVGPGVDCYSMGPITIGPRTVVSQRAFLCAGSHDVADARFQLVVEPIVVGADAWIAAEAMLGPGAVVEDGAVVGARAVLFGRAEAGFVYVGNPATKLRARAAPRP